MSALTPEELEVIFRRVDSRLATLEGRRDAQELADRLPELAERFRRKLLAFEMGMISALTVDERIALERITAKFGRHSGASNAR